MQNILEVIGGQESYFTGKLESYLRAKGIPYQNIPFTLDNIQAGAKYTGFAQIPLVACPDGRWLVDTTLIMNYLDRIHPEPKTAPTDPAANFVAVFLEDYADEWMWRPAMHFRWSFDHSAELLSSWLAEHIPGDDISLADKKSFWRERQKNIFVDGDGVSDETRSAVESIYIDTLASLEAIFEKRDFILGERPTQADFGFMGPMFRHFFCDPHSGRIMRDTSPGVQEWVARMWNMKPQRFASAASIEAIPDDLADILEPAVSAYLPYLVANQQAVVARQEQVSYNAMGVSWSEPVKPYRLWCLDELRRQYQALDRPTRQQVRNGLGEDADAILLSKPTGLCDHLIRSLPIGKSETEAQALDSWGRELEPG